MIQADVAKNIQTHKKFISKLGTQVPTADTVLKRKEIFSCSDIELD